MLECIQMRKREENLGIGATINNENWKNLWWENLYNDVVTKINVQPSDDSNDENSTSSSEEEEDEIEIVSIKKHKETQKNLLNKKRKK